MSNNINKDIFISREDLRNYIHDIHNFLRNSGIGYGQNALKVFNVFYGLKLLEEQLTKLDIEEETKKKLDYKELVKITEEYQCDPGISLFKYIDKILDVLFKLDRENIYPELYKYIFYEIPHIKDTDIEPEVFEILIKKIDKLPVGYKKERRVNLSGKVWEYFVGRDQTAISELGAYFTDRHITDFIFKKLEPELKNNKVPSMIDPFGGSGGFTLGYINYMNEKYDNINWEKNINQIYHYDMEGTVVKMAGLETFAMTGEFPKENNFVRTNSFMSSFDDKKFDYIISNPPYGGDKLKTGTKQIRIKKILNYIKSMKKEDVTSELKLQQEELMEENKKIIKHQQKYQVKLSNFKNTNRIAKAAKEYGLSKLNDKEACSLLLLIDLVEKDGVCAGVLKEGVFFDSKYSSLRKILIEKYNVTHVISVPQNAFENTSTKTSILIFKNNGKTKQVLFTELEVNIQKEDVIELGEDGRVHIKKNKGEINEVIEKKLSMAKYEEIKENNYSLNYKNYNKEEKICPEGYELKKIGDMCENIKYKKNNEDQNGKYKYYTCSENIKKCSQASLTGNYLLLGTRGTLSIHYTNNKFGCGNNLVIFKKKKEISMYYLYLILKKNNNYIKNIKTGSTVSMITLYNLQNIQIPIPKDFNKIKKPLQELEKLHDEINQDEELIPKKEEEIGNMINKYIEEGDYEEKKTLGEVCKFLPISKHKTSHGKKEGKYRFYNSSQNDKLYLNDYEIDKESIIIGNGGNISVHIDKKFTASKHVTVCQLKKNINIKYIYYYLQKNLNKLTSKSSGSTINWLNKKNISEFEIPILKQDKMKELEKLFNEVDELKEKLEENKKTYEKKVNKFFEPLKNYNEDTSEGIYDELDNGLHDKEDKTQINNDINNENNIDNEEYISDTESISSISTTMSMKSTKSMKSEKSKKSKKRIIKIEELDKKELKKRQKKLIKKKKEIKEEMEDLDKKDKEYKKLKKKLELVREKIKEVKKILKIKE